MGFAANICNSIILFAGNIIDMDIGLSMVTEFDPTMNTQVTITGNLYNYFILLLLIATDMHHVILQAVLDSFTVVPINGQIFNWDSLAGSITQYMTDLLQSKEEVKIIVQVSGNCYLRIHCRVKFSHHG